MISVDKNMDTATKISQQIPCNLQSFMFAEKYSIAEIVHSKRFEISHDRFMRKGLTEKRLGIPFKKLNRYFHIT